MLPQEIINRIETKILDTMDILQKKYPQNNLKLIEYSFKQMGRVAGRAWSRENRIEINPDYCLNGELEKMISVTIPHEIAHVVSYQVYGRAGFGHGYYWKSIMINLGLEPLRCHNFNMEGVKLRKVNKPHKYTCGCTGMVHNMTNLRNKQIESGRTFVCTKCKVKIRKFNDSPNLEQKSRWIITPMEAPQAV